MPIGAVSVGVPVNLTASGKVCGGTAMARTANPDINDWSSQAETTSLSGAILGFFCNSTTSGTIVLSKGTASGGTAITGTITPTAGTWYNLPFVSENGLYATIANTLNVTFAVVP